MDTEKEKGLKGQEELITLSMMQLGCRWICSVDQEKGLECFYKEILQIQLMSLSTAMARLLHVRIHQTSQNRI
jgi:hypothetical protein